MDKITTKAVARFEAKYSKEESGCWVWHAARFRTGYGLFQLSSRRAVPAHRVSWEMYVGPIPDGLVLDHLCHNRACVNPAHLHPVTQKQNSENRMGANRNSGSGHRGVHWDAQYKKWRAAVRHEGKLHTGRRHADIEDAIAEAVALRRKLFTNSYEVTA